MSRLLVVCLLALGLSACHFKSVLPLFRPADLDRLTLKDAEFGDSQGAFVFQQFGLDSRTYLVVSKDRGEASDVVNEQFHAGFVKLAGDLYVVQVAPLTIDGVWNTIRLSAGRVDDQAYRDGRHEIDEDFTDGDGRYAYVFMKTTQEDGAIATIQFSMTFSASNIRDDLMEMASRHGVKLDGDLNITNAALDPDGLKAFFLDVWRAHGEAMDPSPLLIAGPAPARSDTP